MTLITLYSDSGDEQFIFSVGTEISIFYEDIDGNPDHGNMISFGVNIDDGK